MFVALLTIATIGMLVGSITLGVRRSLGPLSPFFIFGVGYSFVFGLFPLCVFLSGESRWGYLVSHEREDLRIWALAVVLLGYLCTLISYLATRSNKIRQSTPLSTVSSTPRDRAIFWVLLLVFLLAATLTYSLLVRTHLEGFGEFMTDRIFQMKGLGVIYKPLLLVFPLGFFVLLRVRELKGKGAIRWGALLLILCLVNGSLAVLSGSRFGALMPILYCGVFAILLTKGSRLSRGLLIRAGAVVLSVLVAVSIAGQMRQAVLGTTYSLDELSELTLQEKSPVLSEIRTSFPHFEILMIMLDKDMQWEYGFGQDTFAAILSVIPRKWWKDKPVGAGPIVANIVRPGSYDLGRLSGSSVTTGLLVEGLLAGGVFGVVIFMSIFGAVLALLERKLASLGRHPWPTIGWVLFVMFVCEGLIYSELYGWVGRVAVTLLPLILLNTFFRLRITGLRAAH